MKILITGGSGFIGRNLAEFFRKSCEVLAPTHRELDCLDGEAVARFFQKNEVDALIHAAGVPFTRKIQAPRDVALGNLKMFFNLAAQSERFSKMIFFGSGSEYDRRHDISKARESDDRLHIPEDELGFSKYLCSKYIEKTDRLVSLRLFGVFGKYEDYQIRFISNAICKTIFGLPITLKQNRVFSYLWIDDLCRIVDYFLHHDVPQKVYNGVPAGTVDLLSLAGCVREISGKNPEIIVQTPGQGLEYTGDGSLLERELGGDFRFTPVKEAIRKLYGWYETHRDMIDRESLRVDP